MPPRPLLRFEPKAWGATRATRRPALCAIMDTALPSQPARPDRRALAAMPRPMWVVPRRLAPSGRLARAVGCMGPGASEDVHAIVHSISEERRFQEGLQDHPGGHRSHLRCRRLLQLRRKPWAEPHGVGPRRLHSQRQDHQHGRVQPDARELREPDADVRRLQGRPHPRARHATGRHEGDHHRYGPAARRRPAQARRQRRGCPEGPPRVDPAADRKPRRGRRQAEGAHRGEHDGDGVQRPDPAASGISRDAAVFHQQDHHGEARGSRLRRRPDHR